MSTFFNPRARSFRMNHFYIPWAREATHLSITRRTVPYLSGWKVGRLFSHNCTTTSRARALIRGTGALGDPYATSLASPRHRPAMGRQ